MKTQKADKRFTGGTRIRRVVAASVAILLCCVLLAFAPRHHKRATPVSAPAPPKPVAAPQQIDGQILPDPSVRHTERVWIYGDRIYPDLIFLRPGTVRFQVENETQSDVNLIIESVQPGQRSGQFFGSRSVAERTRRLSNDLTLGAGEYIFYEANSPIVQGRIIVKPM